MRHMRAFQPLESNYKLVVQLKQSLSENHQQQSGKPGGLITGETRMQKRWLAYRADRPADGHCCLHPVCCSAIRKFRKQEVRLEQKETNPHYCICSFFFHRKKKKRERDDEVSYKLS